MPYTADASLAEQVGAVRLNGRFFAPCRALAPAVFGPYTDLRQNLSRYLDEAVNARAPIVVTRQGGKGNVVTISEAEFAGWQETVHLLSSPRNAERLLRGMRQAEAGTLEAHDPQSPNAAAEV
jgi:antitoxin YefM